MEKFAPLGIECLGLVIVISFFWLITVLLMRDGKEEHRKKGFSDFIIGDSNRYSPVRVQAVAWAILIISSHVAIILALLFSKSKGALHSYQPVFPDTILWLLSLSLTSYISMKGIDVNRANHNHLAKQESPKWSDLITSINGLDFGRFQMLIWTIIGLLLYFSYNVDFVSTILSESKPEE